MRLLSKCLYPLQAKNKLMDRSRILAEIKHMLSEFKEIDASYVFGSFLKTDRFNDIDIAILVSNELTAYEKLKFELKVAGELERNIKPRVEFDVKILNYSPVYFQYEAVKNGVAAYVKDQDKRVEYEAHLISDYLDLKEMYEFIDKEYLARA
jgi:predicted nucleotidyltransferase